ncbi:MAG: DUF1059 domain-containing protein [Dehalococcoidia bacterium]|nr:DUF1059 domain-containing protein [Dehalococcoidia bacterium]
MTTHYALSCRDLGIDCDFETTGSNLKEVIRHCAEHAAKDHGIKAFGQELYLKRRSHLRTVEVDARGR